MKTISKKRWDFIGIGLILGLLITNPVYGQTEEIQQPALELKKKGMIPNEVFSQLIQELDLSEAENLNAQRQYSQAIQVINSKLKEIEKYELNLASSEDKLRLADVFNELGQNYFALTMWLTAKEYFFQALNLDPNNRLALLNLALVHLRLKNYKEAKDFANRYLEIGGENKMVGRQIIRHADKMSEKFTESTSP